MPEKTSGSKTAPIRRLIRSFYRMDSYEEAALEPWRRELRFLVVVIVVAFSLQLILYEVLRRRHANYVAEHGPEVAEHLKGIRFVREDPHALLKGTLALPLSEDAVVQASNAPERAPEPTCAGWLVVDATGIRYGWPDASETFEWNPSADSTFALDRNGLGRLASHWALRDMTSVKVPATWKAARLIDNPILDLVPLGTVRLGLGTFRDLALGDPDDSSIGMVSSAVPGFAASDGKLAVKLSWPVWNRQHVAGRADYFIQGGVSLEGLRAVAMSGGFKDGFTFTSAAATSAGFMCEYPEGESAASQVIEELGRAAVPTYEFAVSRAGLGNLLLFSTLLAAAVLFAFIGGFIATRGSETRIDIGQIARIATRASVPGLLVAALAAELLFPANPWGILAAFVGAPVLYGGMAAKRVAESERFSLLAPPPEDD